MKQPKGGEKGAREELRALKLCRREKRLTFDREGQGQGRTCENSGEQHSRSCFCLSVYGSQALLVVARYFLAKDCSTTRPAVDEEERAYVERLRERV